jgi:hypothetical protein
MSFTKELEEFRAKRRKQIPPVDRAIVDRYVEHLAKSKIVDNALKVGDPAPEFTLTDSAGESITLSQLLENGPLVMSFYRGGW